MAGDWIKMRGNLWDDPRVAKIVDMTDSSEAAVVGALYWLWSTADQHTEDGILPGLTLRSIDRKTGVKGFAEALCAIDWLADHPEGVRIVDFEKHNGTSAKKRCQTAKRVANFTAANAKQTPDIDETNADGVSCALAREREEKSEYQVAKATSSTAKLPTCPHEVLIDLFGEHLPTLPQPKKELWDGARADAMRSRWKWVLTAKKKSGARYATDKDEAVAWFGRFFAHVAKSEFLTAGNKWVPDLGWLMKAENFCKVIQGNYDHKEAA
jgi:hypothetical protein